MDNPLHRWPTWEEFRLLLGWLFATLVGGLLPTWGGYLIFRIGQRPLNLADFVSGGEFALYSASLIAPTLFILFREYPHAFRWRLPLGLFLVLLLVAACLIFAAVLINTKFQQNPPISLDIDLLALVSVVLYVSSLVCVAIATQFDLMRPSYDPRAVQRQQVEQLSADFHKTDASQGGSNG